MGQLPIFCFIDLAENNYLMPVAEGSVSDEKRYTHGFLMPDLSTSGSTDKFDKVIVLV